LKQAADVSLEGNTEADLEAKRGTTLPQSLAPMDFISACAAIKRHQQSVALLAGPQDICTILGAGSPGLCHGSPHFARNGICKETVLQVKVTFFITRLINVSYRYLKINVQTFDIISEFKML